MRIILLAALIVLLTACLSIQLAHADQVSARSEIEGASAKVLACFNAAKAAESAGANVSGLTRTLTNAGLLLSDAELAYSQGFFDEAQSLAVQCRDGLSAFISAANSLEDAAALRSQQDFMLNIVGSIAGTVAVVVGSIVTWLLLKRRYRSV